MIRFVVLSLLPLVLAACTPAEGEGESEGEGEGEGEGEEGEGEGEGEEGEGEGEGELIDNPYGFTMRVPGTHVIDGSNARDVDYLCTLSIDGHDAVVYLRATPTSLGGGFFPVPVYDEVDGFLWEADQVTAVDASYDYGGNHNNDFFTITLGGVRYTWDHSSYGYGFRACQPPDCLKREEGSDFDDGCQPDRTMPEACIEVSNPLPALVDGFAVCAGDPG
ncbi:MAG: hypothetical protein IT383_16780 [Deltaproteobacteria bacterium]|nr:hypothetical protein [Deltaproteobacteria bacterium]